MAKTTIEDVQREYGFTIETELDEASVFSAVESAVADHLTPGRFNGRPPNHGLVDDDGSQIYRVQSVGLAGQSVFDLGVSYMAADSGNTVSLTIYSAILKGGKLVGDTSRRLKKFRNSVAMAAQGS